MPTLMLLGNCVAQRLADRLAGLLPRLGSAWQVVPAPPIHHLAGQDAELSRLAGRARACDRVFTQPLFGFGPCNTAALGQVAGLSLQLFSAPNFEAYFPDVLAVGGAGDEEVFPPPLEWHSRIIVQCCAAGIDESEVPALYLNHPLFRPRAARQALEQCREKYLKREQGVELGTWDFVQREFARQPLFHTWNHPALPLMEVLLDKLLQALDVPPDRREAALHWSRSEDWGFGFNSWPIITRHHSLYHFAGREGFRVAGVDTSIEDMATGYYNYYKFHPKVFAAALAASRAE